MKLGFWNGRGKPISASAIMGGGAVDPTAAYTTIIEDSFTDTNGVDLNAHTIAPTNTPSTAWVNIYTTSGRAIEIQSNKAKPLGEGYAGLEAGEFNVDLSVIVSLALSTSVAHIFLRQDNLTDVTGIRNNWTVVFGNGAITLNERNAANPGTQRATASLTTSATTNYTIRAVCIGNDITVYVDGVQKLTYTTTTHQTSTKFGIASFADNTTFDSFKIRANP